MAGATGLVGQYLVEALCRLPAVSGVLLLGRRAPVLVHEKLTSLIGPADSWPTLMEGRTFDIAISTLGTTIRDAGSPGAFAAIDHDAVLSVARAARGAGARQMLLVSSVGAHAASRNFYLETKGKAEASVANVGFDRLDIARPGLLRGARKGRLRLGEKLGMMISPVTDFLTPAVLSRYRSINSETVAGALARLVGATEPGLFVHHNDEMAALAGER